MGAVVTTGRSSATIRTSLDGTVVRALAALRGVPSPEAHLRGMRWRAGELGAHLAQTIVVFTQGARGEVTAYGEDGAFNAATDERLVAELEERDPGRLAELTEEGYAGFREAIAGLDDATTLPRLQGFSVAAICAAWLLDLNIHGTQLAEAGRQPWRIDPLEVRAGFEALLPYVYDRVAARGFRGVYALHLRGAPPLVYGFADGTLTVGEAAGAVDCHLGVEPFAFLLTSIGAMPQWQAFLTGRVRSWGRRPWLAGRVATLFPRVPHGGLARRA